MNTNLQTVLQDGLDPYMTHKYTKIRQYSTSYKTTYRYFPMILTFLGMRHTHFRSFY